MNYEKFTELLEYENECTYLDFKECEYERTQYNAFIKDIMSMANAEYDSDRYIVAGVRHQQGEENEYIGVNEFTDEATYQSLIHENIEPEIEIQYLQMEHLDKKFGVYIIKKCDSKPYLIKKDRGQLKKGDCWIRKGCYQKPMSRYDIETIFNNREEQARNHKEDLLNRIELLNLELLYIDAFEAEKQLFEDVYDNYTDSISSCEKYYEGYRYSRDYCTSEFMKDQEMTLIRRICSIEIKKFNKQYYFEILTRIQSKMRKKYIEELIELENSYVTLLKSTEKTKKIELDYIEHLSNNTSTEAIYAVKNSLMLMSRAVSTKMIMPKQFRNESLFKERREEILSQLSEYGVDM